MDRQSFEIMNSLDSTTTNNAFMKLQEESFSKMQLEIIQLQNKIKGLETKLSPYSVQRINEN